MKFYYVFAYPVSFLITLSPKNRDEAVLRMRGSSSHVSIAHVPSPVTSTDLYLIKHLAMRMYGGVEVEL